MCPLRSAAPGREASGNEIITNELPLDSREPEALLGYNFMPEAIELLVSFLIISYVSTGH